jgi:hypothetical protein
MGTPSVEASKPEQVVVIGVDGESIEITAEQLEMRIMPSSLAGFLD